MADSDPNITQDTTTAEAEDVKVDAHNSADTELLYRIYLSKRLDSQTNFYKSRVRENEANANFTFMVSTAVMSISALVAAVSAVASSPIFSLLSAILPALAALMAAFRQLYGWERQISIYQDALMGLERVKLMTPDRDSEPDTDFTKLYPNLVLNGEQVFTGEVNQWGQFVQTVEKGEQAESTDTRVTNALMDDLRLTDDQINTIRRIMAAGTPKPAFSEDTITVHPEETSALPSGGVAPSSGAAPTAVSATHISSTTIHPQESTDAFPSEDQSAVQAQTAPAPVNSTPIAVTTTRVDTTVVEHVIPPAAAAPTTAQFEPPQEAAESLAPGAAHVDVPNSEDIEALANHHEVANEPPPPEAMSALTPGAMHVDAPQPPPENPEGAPVSTDNG